MTSNRRLGDDDRERDAADRAIRTLFPALDVEALRQPQDPSSGVNAIIGKWPGDEDDETFNTAVEELS